MSVQDHDCSPVPVSLLREKFSYDPESGTFTRKGWRKSTPFPCEEYSYTRVTFEGRKVKIYLHVLAWVLHYGEFPKGKIHHIDDDWLNNRITNLKVQNDFAHARRQRMKKSNTSGAKGVFWDRERSLWRAEITVGRKAIFLGRFADKQDALAAYISASEEYHGEDGRVEISDDFLRPKGPKFGASA